MSLQIPTTSATSEKCPYKFPQPVQQTEKCPYKFHNQSNRNDKLLQHECEITLDRINARATRYGTTKTGPSCYLHMHAGRNVMEKEWVHVQTSQPSVKYPPALVRPPPPQRPTPLPPLSLLLQQKRIYCSSTVGL